MVSQPLQNFIQQFIQLNAEDVALLEASITQLNFQKGDYFISAGKTSDSVAFLLEGIARVYYLADDKEITSYFNTTYRNPLIASFVSLLTQQPSKESIHFLTDAKVLMISKTQLENLYAASKNFERFGRLMAEYNYVLAMERIYALQHSAALDRYKALLEQYPNLLNEIPHHFIASYLGIAPESMSRLRKQLQTLT